MKNIVIIAHDAKKPEMVQFLNERMDWIQDVNLVATGRTAEYVESNDLVVKHMSPGKYGGYNEITNMIKKGEIDIVVFFRDPNVKQPHHEDIQELLDQCDKNNIPLATNHSSAELLILGLIKKEDYERSKRDSN
jgi:methylglyoxal synthase